MRRILREARVDYVDVRSAGTMTSGGSLASEGAAVACREVEVDLTGHRSSPLTRSLISWADMILCMEHHHATTISDAIPSASAKTHLLGEFGPSDGPLEIADPVGMSLPHYRDCRDQLFDCLKGLLEQLPEIERRWDTIFLGSDDAGLILKNRIVSYLAGQGRKIQDCGPTESEGMDDLGAVVEVGRRVGGHLAQFGILVGVTGIGMSIAANKIPGVRAALCASTEYAVLSREFHDANVLCLGANTHSESDAFSIVDAWLSAEYKGGDDNARVRVFEQLEYEFSSR